MLAFEGAKNKQKYETKNLVECGIVTIMNYLSAKPSLKCGTYGFKRKNLVEKKSCRKKKGLLPGQCIIPCKVFVKSPGE